MILPKTNLESCITRVFSESGVYTVTYHIVCITCRREQVTFFAIPLDHQTHIIFKNFGSKSGFQTSPRNSKNTRLHVKFCKKERTVADPSNHTDRMYIDVNKKRNNNALSLGEWCSYQIRFRGGVSDRPTMKEFADGAFSSIGRDVQYAIIAFLSILAGRTCVTQIRNLPYWFR